MKSPAPYYRHASMCSTCEHFIADPIWCEKYGWECDPYYICDNYKDEQVKIVWPESEEK